MLLLVTAALARDVDLKVHDMKGVVTTGEVVVELGDPGQKPASFTLKDDGVAPDAIAGDHLYTARAEDLAVEHGSVVVRAGDRKWEGGFQFDAKSDPVLLIGLEESGFAAASTREVMFVPQDRMPAPGADGAAPPPGGVPGAPPPGGAPGAPGATAGAPGGAPPPGGIPGAPGGGADAAIAPGVSGSDASARQGHTGLPDGMWMGWIVGVAALGGLGAVAWAAASRARSTREPAFETRAARGPWTPAPERTDLFLGAGRGLAMGEGRWTPEEVALAARRVRGPVRVVVTAPDRLAVEGDGYAALAAVLSGVADLLWVESAAR